MTRCLRALVCFFPQASILTRAFRWTLTSTNSFRAGFRWISRFMPRRKCKFELDREASEIRKMQPVSFRMREEKKKVKLRTAKLTGFLFLKKKTLLFCLGGFLNETASPPKIPARLGFVPLPEGSANAEAPPPASGSHHVF